MPISKFLSALSAYFARRNKQQAPITESADLREFLDTRSAHVAQTSLYGYLRARAGNRFPELFDDDPFIELLNIAKWHIWLACLGDLAVFAGDLLCRSEGMPRARSAGLVTRLVDEILEKTGQPADAGPEFAAHAGRIRSRLALHDWSSPCDDEAAFTQSPDALVEWAPMIDEFKKLDAGIVRNSMRFRWREVRADLRRRLNAAAVLASEAPRA